MTRYPIGINLVANGQCPKGGLSSMACMFCPEGHMTECHAGMSCEEADCDHYRAQQVMDRNDPDRSVR
jgi:hypothetical protein